MSRLPSGFEEDYQTMRLHFDWATQSGLELNVPMARTTTEEVGDFLERWQGKTTIPEIECELGRIRAWMLEMMRDLERAALCHLRELVEARKDWEVGEMFLRMSVAFIGLVQETPREMVPELCAIYRDHMGYEFDATTEYRDSEALAEQGEALYRQALQGFETDWPEKLTPALRRRLAGLTLVQAQAWMEELGTAIDALDAMARPELNPASA